MTAAQESSVEKFGTVHAKVQEGDNEQETTRGASLRELQRFFEEHDKDKGYAGLRRVADEDGTAVWTLLKETEVAAQLERRARERHEEEQRRQREAEQRRRREEQQQQRRAAMVAQLTAERFVDEATARRHLEQAGWDLQAAMESCIPPVPDSPVKGRTLATSNFKAAYGAAAAPQGQMDMGFLLGELIKAYCEQEGIAWRVRCHLSRAF